MIDLEREGENKYEHHKLYEVILVNMYMESSRDFVSYDILSKNKNKTEIRQAKTGERYIVPGYFLNDWNNRINPKTGFVYYWFQLIEPLTKETQRKITLYAQKVGNGM